jgi:hypothetical protein
MKRLRLISFACALATAALLAVGGASAGGSRTNDADCTWGASSVIATTVNGQLVESQPQTTGCIPNP